MKLKDVPAAVALSGSFAVFSMAQPPATTVPAPTAAVQASELLAKRIDELRNESVSQKKREEAYAKLLEGQRHVWRAGRLRSQAGIASTSRMARKSFLAAVELNPKMAEGYTALAELALNIQPGDIDEAIKLAELSIRISPDNFGSRRILARLYTFKSKLNTDELDPAMGQKAIEAWKNVARLDPRNAEAWAFLAEFYNRTGSTDDQIEVLRKWISSAPPLDTQFYARFMGPRGELSPETASVKLGEALIKAKRVGEAIETLSLVLADSPENTEAADLLREALESADGATPPEALSSLEQAVMANPQNVSLITLLARAHVRGGRFQNGADLLRRSAARVLPANREAASMLLVTLGDIYIGNDSIAEGLAAYDEAFKARGLDPLSTLSDDEREFAMYVFEKMIQTLKAANRTQEVKDVIERARRFLGDTDLFAERQLISFYRESGDRQGALDAVRSVRTRFPDDYGFIRLEATLLTEMGKTDEAVAMIRKLIGRTNKPAEQGVGGSDKTVAVAVPAYDDFSNYLFISNLYSFGNRGKEAADAANQAYSVARGVERKQIARLTLATAQQLAKDYAGAESTLREILKESPGNPIAMNNLGYFLLERDDRIEEALSLIQQAVRVDPTNPSYLDSLGWAFYKLGRLDEAEKKLKEAARYDSGSGTIQEHLGDLYIKKGQVEMARTSWEKALNLSTEASDTARLKAKIESSRSK